MLIRRLPPNQRPGMNKMSGFAQLSQMLLKMPDIRRNVNPLIMENKPDHILIVMGFTVSERAGFINKDA